MRHSLIGALFLWIPSIHAYYATGSNPNQVSQYMEQTQYNPAADINRQRQQTGLISAGPTSSVSIQNLRASFTKQWNVCDSLFQKVAETCKSTEDLDEKNAKACVQMYQIAYNSCSRSMNVFAYQFV